MYKFEDLKWKTHPTMQGEMAHIFFENGYGCSVVTGEKFYSNGTHVDYELAVICGDEDERELCYDTYLTDDVIGYISSERVEEILNKVAALPPV